MWKTLVLLAALGGGDETVLLDFTASWCPPCRQMAPVIERLVSQGYSVRKVDIDKEPDLATRFGVRQVPCFVLLANGREVTRLQGSVSYDRLVRMFDDAPGNIASAPRTASRAAASPPLARGQSPDPSDGAGNADPFRGRRPAPQLAPPQTEGTGVPTTDAPANGAVERALQASVLLTVEESTGRSQGTGAIIDVRNDEALVLTCGHLFRGLKPGARITAQPCSDPSAPPLAAEVLEYDFEKRDIGLVSIRLAGWRAQSVQVAPAGFVVKNGMSVFSIGCDHGGQARVAPSSVTGVNRYLGAPNIEVAGQPVEGRSGGGLFTSDGLLIGVCNHADTQANEGLYAALDTIHWQLDQIGLREVYARAGANTPAGAEAMVANETPPETPVMPVHMPKGGPSRDAQSFDPGALAQDADAEVICIVRSRTRPQDRPNVIFLDRASPEFLEHLQKAQSRPPADESISDGRRGEPLYRGQSQD